MVALLILNRWCKEHSILPSFCLSHTHTHTHTLIPLTAPSPTTDDSSAISLSHTKQDKQFTITTDLKNSNSETELHPALDHKKSEMNSLLLQLST